LNPYSHIVQAWGTPEFPDASPDSNLVVGLEPLEGETKVILHYFNLPGQEVEVDSMVSGSRILRV
jgi:hypothetical protein